jgi:hypothetical protein
MRSILAGATAGAVEICNRMFTYNLKYPLIVKRSHNISRRMYAIASVPTNQRTDLTLP